MSTNSIMRTNWLTSMMVTLLVATPAAAEDNKGRDGIPDPSIATSLPRHGDPSGDRAALAAQGVTFGVNYIGEVLGNTSGGFSQATIHEGRAEFVLDADLDKLLAWKGAAFHFNIYGIHGDGLSAGHIGNLMAVSNIEAPPTTRLFEIWIEQKFFHDKAALRFGHMGADNEFITSAYGGQFINGAFGWPAIAASGLRSGGPAYPLANPGARLKLDPTPDLTLLGAFFSGDPAGPGNEPDPQTRNPDGLNFGFVDKPLILLEAQHRYNQKAEATGLPGTVKAGGWIHMDDFEDQLTGGRKPGNYGLYAILDQQLYALADAKDKGVGLFLRLAGAPSDRNLIDFYADGGLQFSGLVPQRPDDTFGVALGYGRISSRAAEADFHAGALERDFEAALEINYTAQILPGWTVQPECQYIWHPGGGVADDNGERVKDATVFGLRTVINY